MKIVALESTSYIKILDKDDGAMEELEFSDGNKPEKQYHVEIKLNSDLNPNNLSCSEISVALKVANDESDLANVAGLYPTVANISLEDLSQNKCRSTRDFIITNLSEGKVENTDIIPLRGGIGNKVKVESTNLNIERDYSVPIEPVGIIVIAIDGLRQDVLYAESEEQVKDQLGNYYVEPSQLSGLCEVLGGKYDGNSNTCDPAGWEDKHIKLQNVTAVFPSITLASWASVFTGRMPGPAEDIIDGDGNIVVPRGTGILGNEFFARDRSLSVPARFNNPSGIISLGSGAFKGFDAFPKWALKDYDFLVPYQPDWKDPITPEDTPQNYIEILKPNTLFENIKEIEGVESYFSERGGDPVVIANLHYARGAYWLTWDLDLKFGGSSIVDVPKTLDHQSWDKLDDYLDGKYLSGWPLLKKRNDIPFSALTVWYLPGLDKKAHREGMGVYKDYFMNTTDEYIKKVVDKLKDLDEFDNKIFIIVADHGMTAMPTNLRYKYGTWLGIFDRYLPADTVCELKLDFVDPDSPSATYKKQMAELENNNLHIWELGKMFKSVGSIQGTAIRRKYNLLVPKEIEAIFVNESVPVEYRPTATLYDADIVAAFNGPMAHIYSMIGTDNKTLGEIAEIFKLMLSYYPSDAHWLGFNDIDDYIEFQEETVGRLWKSIDKILIRKEDSTYYVFNGLDTNGYPITDGLDTLTGSEYIEAELRIKGMNNKNRSGDIVLIMKDKMNDSTIDRFTTGSACKSWHGSLNPSDSYVPLIVSYPGGHKKEIEDILEKDTLCKTNYSECRGNWKVTDIIKEIIKEQYQ